MKPHNFQLNLMEVPTATGSCVILNDMFTVDDSWRYLLWLSDVC